MEEQTFVPRCLLCPSRVGAINLSEFGPEVSKLGSGAYGNVTKHTSKRFGNVAIKTLPQRQQELAKSSIREISALVSLFPHPDIIGTYGFSLPHYTVAEAKNPTKTSDVSVVLELGLMSLSDAIMKGYVSGDTMKTKDVMYQIFRGTNYMHQQDIWHRDIKPQNVIVTQLEPTIKVKIADFGLSRSGPYCGISPTQVMYTIWYRPPEILINEVMPRSDQTPVYDESAEIWALGILMWDILSAATNGRKLLRSYDKATPIDQLALIFKVFGFTEDQANLRTKLNRIYWPFGQIPVTAKQSLVLRNMVNMQADTWSLISQMLVTEPTKRITLGGIFKHKYFSDTPYDTPAIEAIPQLQVLYKNESTVLSKECIAKIPGANYQAKLDMYSAMVHEMLDFVVETGMSKDLATFFISTSLLGCIIGNRDSEFKNVGRFRAAGLICVVLAGKYYSRRPAQILDAAGKLTKDVTIPAKIAVELANSESVLFQLLNGRMHYPTCYRFMVEMFGDECPIKGGEYRILFAWSYCIMCAVSMTKAVFVGKPSDVAKLSIQIAAHYLKVDLSGLPHVAMDTKELSQGAKLAYVSFSTLHPQARSKVVDTIISILNSLLATTVSVDSPTFMAILEGKAHANMEVYANVRDGIIADEEETSEVGNAAKPVTMTGFEFSPVGKTDDTELTDNRPTKRPTATK